TVEIVVMVNTREGSPLSFGGKVTPAMGQLILALGFAISSLLAVLGMRYFFKVCESKETRQITKIGWLAIGAPTFLVALFGCFSCWSQQVTLVMVVSMLGFGALGVCCGDQKRNRLWGLLAGAVGGAFAGTLALAIFWLMEMGVPAVATLGVPIVLLVFVLGEMVYVGLAGVNLTELEREWWSAINSRLIISAFVWAALFSIAVYGPWVFDLLAHHWTHWSVSLAGVGWLGGILSGLLAAQSSSTGDQKSKVSELVAAVAPVLFLITVFFLVSVLWTWATYDAYGAMTGNRGFWETVRFPNATQFLDDIPVYKRDQNGTPIIVLYIIAFPCLYLLSWAYTRFIGVNTFSLQNLYANRLSRCYLGASNTKRVPNLLTNFDAKDNICLSKLRPDSGYSGSEVGFKSGPVHLVNGALNLNASPSEAQLATQSRKAESFVFTPFACGSDTTKYCSTKSFAGDITLGNALAVSGAAVSPNMGYHSAPAITALLTLFNVRLGAWFGNPSNDKTRHRTEPTNGLNQLLSEMFGAAATDEYVYLSDGGHFENMGVYELLRRRCRYIVTVDADSAPDFHENIGRVVRMARIDFDVRIELDSEPITPNEDGVCEAHLVVGRIHYDNVHSPGEQRSVNDPNFVHENNQGIIVWISLGVTGDEPEDIRNYRAMSKTGFPYQSTSDQFFDENQFESYRELGVHAVDSMLKNLTFPGPSGKGEAEPESTYEPMFESLATQSCQGFKAEEKMREVKRDQLENKTLFKSIYDHWLPRPVKFLGEYVGQNQQYLAVLERLRGDDKLARLANELYGNREGNEAPVVVAGPVPLAESLMVGQMMTLLENVWFSLDLEHNYLHPVHRGWKGVFTNWLASPTVQHCWKDIQVGHHTESGLRQEFSPVFRRFVNKVVRTVQEEAEARNVEE
ncbi:MAG: hypothetical protein AB8B55_12450, partial [Mariniblastus sp.]